MRSTPWWATTSTTPSWPTCAGCCSGSSADGPAGHTCCGLSLRRTEPAALWHGDIRRGDRPAVLPGQLLDRKPERTAVVTVVEVVGQVALVQGLTARADHRSLSAQQLRAPAVRQVHALGIQVRAGHRARAAHVDGVRRVHAGAAPAPGDEQVVPAVVLDHLRCLDLVLRDPRAGGDQLRLGPLD